MVICRRRAAGVAFLKPGSNSARPPPLVMVICRRRAAGVAFLEPGSNSARTTPPPGGSKAYKVYIRKPKGLTRLHSLSEVFIRSYSSDRSLAAFRRVIVITFADQRYRVENKLLAVESVRNRVGRSEFESSR